MNNLFKTFIITIGICFLFLFLKNQYACLLLTNSTYGMPALIKQRSVQNLYIGSSMFKQGLDIETLGKDSNYILSYNGNQPALEFYELKYLLDHGVQIENLYVDMYVYSAWENPKISDEKLFMEVSIPEKLFFWNLIKETSENSLQALWRIWVNSNNELILTWPISSPIINSQFCKGGSLNRPENSSKNALDQIPIPSVAENMNSFQEYYIKELINLAEEKNIDLLFIETPKYESVAKDASYLSAMTSYAHLLDQENIAYIISENTKQYCHLNHAHTYSFDITEENNYADTMHLSYNGRIAFTNALLNTLPFN